MKQISKTPSLHPSSFLAQLYSRVSASSLQHLKGGQGTGLSVSSSHCLCCSFLFKGELIPLFCGGNLFFSQANMGCRGHLPHYGLHHGWQRNLSSGACSTSSSSSFSADSGVCRASSLHMLLLLSGCNHCSTVAFPPSS